MDVIQLLPLNDIGLDNSPYSSISAFALNPIHLSLNDLPQIKNDTEFFSDLQDLKGLTLSPKVLYIDVRYKKECLLRKYFAKYGSSLSQNPSFTSFKAAHADWLLDYAAFKTIKILRSWQRWQDWPTEYQPALARDSVDPLEIEFHIFLQYLCFQQLSDVKHYATSHHMLIKGDIPILLNSESADVWRYQDLFNLQLGAGAPPDIYSQTGQNWGFPLYNWDQLASTDYHWWIRRLQTASKIYHMYRLDHIVGFFRIWAVPLDKSPKEGFFLPEDPDTWLPQGKAILKVMLENCSMLPIGEDLGTVPPEIKKCMQVLGICGTKVMRWEKNWNTDNSYIEPKEYSPISMTTVSTHDSESLKLWWKNHPADAKLYAKTQHWPYLPDLTQAQHQAILHSSHTSGSLFHINPLQEYLALIPGLSWPNPNDERINIPGLVLETNWTYRFRPSIETLSANTELKTAIKEILSA